MPELARAGARQRVLVLGGGFGGAYAAQRLGAKLPPTWELTLVDRNNYMCFYPLLVEACVGTLEARHVIVPIRKFLSRGELLMANVEAVDLERQVAQIRVIGADRPQRLHYDQLIIAVGSTTKFPPIPGLKEHAFQFKSLADGIELRDRAIKLLELANTIQDRERRRAILRFVIVGANFNGAELAGEYQHFLLEAAKTYRNVDHDDVDVVVLELADRILGAVDEELATYAHALLTHRGIDIRTKTSVKSVAKDHVILTTGERLETQTTIWCAGIAPNPVLDLMEGLPRNRQGYIECGPDMQVRGYENVWAVGDIATILDPEGHPYPATAQHATREGSHVADNLLRSLADERTHPFRFNTLGSLAALGGRAAVVKMLGFQLVGFPAWFMYRTVYLFKMPSWSRRIRIMMDWTTDLLFRKDPVQLGIRTTAQDGCDD